jgi:hypothetical protein
MTKDYTSEFIFSLADKYGVDYVTSKPCQTTDEEYDSFCQEYSVLSKKRDVALKKHLISNPKNVRTFLPWRPYIIDTVFQTQWYYDEVVIYDPIYFHINQFKEDDPIKNKENLRYILNAFKALRESISEGFLLFASYESFTESTKSLTENNFESLLSIKEVQEELTTLPRWYRLENPPGSEKPYYSIRAYYRNKQTFFTVVTDYEKIKNPDGTAGIEFNFMADHTELGLEHIKQAGIFDRCFDSFKVDYPYEIKETLRYLEIAPSIKTPVLFNRRLDELIVASVSQDIIIPTSRANNNYSLFLPYVDGIPMERLLEIRMKMPDAFLDFRSAMFDLIYEIQKGTSEQELIELKIRQKVNPILKSLDAEMKNTVSKAKIMSLGVPLASGIGSLGLLSFGIDPSKYASVLLGGIGVVEVTALANYIIESRKNQSSDFYFLWKANQNS